MYFHMLTGNKPVIDTSFPLRLFNGSHCRGHAPDLKAWFKKEKKKRKSKDECGTQENLDRHHSG